MSKDDIKKAVNDAEDMSLLTPDLSILREGRRKPPIFPLELLGQIWGDWLSAAAEGAGAPVDYVVGALMGGASALMGNARRVAAWEGWVEPAALWCANVGSPSSGKSPGADPVLNLLRIIEKDMSKGFEQTRREWETEKTAASCAREAWEAAVKKAVKEGKEPPAMPAEAEAPPELIRPRIMANDTSTEKLGLLLAQHHKGLLHFRDELSGWLGSFGRYNGGGADRAFWIEAYGGRHYTIDRVKHTLPINIPYLLVGVLGGIQPDKLVDVIHGEDDGLMARFLWFWPNPVSPSRPRSHVDTSAVLNALRRLAALGLEDDTGDGVLRPHIVRLTEDAATLFQKWREEHIQNTENSVGPLASCYGKAPGHILRLALVLEHLWWAINPTAPEPSSIGKKAVAAAAHLMEGYFKPMAERVFGDVSIPEDERLAATLAGYIVRKRPGVINLRDIRREAGLPGLRKPEKVKLAAKALIEAAWLLPPTAPTGTGRPREDYTVNPKLWEMLP